PVPPAQLYEASEPVLHVKAESGEPLRSGFVFSRQSNLWLLSTDTKRERRLTFFAPPDEYAESPAWSPDGKLIAFAFSPKTAPQDIPSEDIWVVNPDGSGARQLVAHGQDESLLDPAWSADGCYLYFT